MCLLSVECNSLLRLGFVPSMKNMLIYDEYIICMVLSTKILGGEICFGIVLMVSCILALCSFFYHDL